MRLDDELVFCVSLKSRSNSKDWVQVSRYLENTVKSIKGSTDERFHILVVGHEKPDFLNHIESGVTFLQAPFAPPSTKDRGRPMDKARKRRFGGAWLRENIEKSVRLAFVDADDLVSTNLVKTAMDQPSERSLIIDSGYRFDLRNSDLELISNQFYRHCGSCLLPVFKAEELPDTWEDESKVFSHLGPHSKLTERFKVLGRPLEKIDYPAITYMTNHVESLEHSKKGMRDGLIENQFSDAEKKLIFQEQFSIDIKDFVVG